MFAHIISGAESAANVYYYTISASANGIDLWADIVADNGGVAPSQSTIEVTINSGVEIGAVDNTSGTNYAIDIDSNFASKTLKIFNNGYISGFGGDGGEWDDGITNNPIGKNGGCGINFDSGGTVTVENTGTIAGGGGGGGGNTGTFSDSSFDYYADGGGGAGIPAGSAGGGYPLGSSFGASNGTKTQGGLRSLGVPDNADPGGNGGNLGVAGVSPVGGSNGGNAGPPYQVISGTVTVTNSGSGTVIGNPI